RALAARRPRIEAAGALLRLRERQRPGDARPARARCGSQRRRVDLPLGAVRPRGVPGPAARARLEPERPAHAVGEHAPLLQSRAPGGQPRHGSRPPRRAQTARRTKSGATPYALALRFGNLATAAALAAQGADTSDVRAADRLIAACAAGDEHAARALLADSPDLVAALADEAGDAVGLFAERAEPAPLALAL